MSSHSHLRSHARCLKTGTGPGEFRTPHAIEFDSQGWLIVADHHNHRIQILTKEGKYLVEWREFSRMAGLAIDGNDTIYAADSESDPKRHPGWLKGIRVGSLNDGRVTIFVPPHKTDAPDGAMGERIAIDSASNLFRFNLIAIQYCDAHPLHHGDLYCLT